MQICYAEIEALKEQVELDEKERVALEETILNLKREANGALGENQRLFQENEKQRHLI